MCMCIYLAIYYTFKQNRINTITEYDWYEKGLISGCRQVDWNINTNAKNKN